MAARRAEFEEKEFEAPLYNQLENGTRLVWSPGQVFEQYVGIDRALFLSDLALWRFFGSSIAPRGVHLNRYAWRFWDDRPRRPLPTFRLNLFIQAKRNYYHRRTPRNLRARMDGRDCWRFDIDEAQQEAIGAVAKKVGGRALVCYAAPAFHRVLELNAHTVRGTIIQHSTFPQAEKLTGHGSFYYCAAGGSGIANPDFEEIEGPGLVELLQGMRNQTVTAVRSVTEELNSLALQIESVMQELPETNPRRAVFFQRIREADRITEDYETIGESGRAFLRVANFAFAFNLDWYAVDPSDGMSH